MNVTKSRGYKFASFFVREMHTNFLIHSSRLKILNRLLRNQLNSSVLWFTSLNIRPVVFNHNILQIINSNKWNLHMKTSIYIDTYICFNRLCLYYTQSALYNMSHVTWPVLLIQIIEAKWLDLFWTIFDLKEEQTHDLNFRFICDNLHFHAQIYLYMEIVCSTLLGYSSINLEFLPLSLKKDQIIR